MLASTIDSPREVNLRDPALLYEPKLDGIRGLILIEPAQPSPRITIWSRNGNDKTHQFPEVVRGLKEFGKRLRVPVMLDGEIVALTELGEPAGFQRLQGRMHLTGERDIARSAAAQSAAFIAFDVLRDGAQDLRSLPLTDRRARLERVFGSAGASSTVRLGDFVASDGRRLYQTAIARGWEGLIIKAADSIYESGRRSRAWRKLKLVKEQEFVIGGWTEPRETRTHFGALLLGVYEPGARGATLRYVGHTGTGFTHQELARVHAIAEGARDRGVTIHHEGREQRASALGAPGAGVSGEVHRVDGRTRAASPGVSRPARRYRSEDDQDRTAEPAARRVDRK